MTTKNTYNPEDIEALLTNKTFDELLPEEKEFVLQHVESKDEYTLLRTTLLAIKKSSENDELIEANPKIKEDLLLLMEDKARRGAGWFNLNGLWSFLFPEDVFMFKKPGFQLASFAVVLFFGFYFSGKFLNYESNNLAINDVTSPKQEAEKELFKDTGVAIQQEEEEIIKEVVIEAEKEQNENQNEPIRIEEQVTFNKLDVQQDIAPVPAKQRSFVDQSLEDAVMIVEKEADSEPMEDAELSGGVNSLANDELELLQEEVAMDKVATKTVVETDNYNRIAEVSTASTSKKESVSQNTVKNIESQSLQENEAVIDLLYVTF